MFKKKKTLNLKSSYLRYFKENNHETWFQEKKVFLAGAQPGIF